MSCQMNVFAYVADTYKIKKFLFPDSVEQVLQTEEDNDGWDEDWGAWNDDMKPDDDTDVTENDSSPDTNNSWLQQCILSLSPANDIMAVANQDRCVLLSQKFQKNGSNTEVETNLTVNWEGSLSQTDGEVITAVMCLPLASQKRSTQGAPDWTCVIVGFSTGYVRIYTESGALLLSQLLHTEPVQKLKCRTYEPHRYLGLAEQQEEVVIMYQRVLVTIDGFSLVQSLRACRNQVARATASGSENFFQPPPLAYKKWGLQDQEKIFDFCSCGVDTPNPFDNMKAASVSGNPQTALRHTPPAAGLYMTTGIGQYVGFFYTIEGSTQPILSEVAYAVANKLKSAFVSATSGWLGFGGRQKDEVKHGPKIEPATPLSVRFGLPDKNRHGVSVYLSPSENYAATTDSFGRVVLIDIQRGVAIRMWKGYRDAQLGWVQVKELSNHGANQSENQSRTAQFLVIYAPRRGILEVWTAGLGPRVAAFNVSKSCTLICPSYGIMGLNNVTVRGINTKAFQCALMDTDGTLKTLHIPFHLALSDKNDKRARDLHLLRTLKALIKDKSQQTDFVASIIRIIQDMRTANIMQQGIDRVLAVKSLSAKDLETVLKSATEHLSQNDDKLDLDGRLFLKYCEIQNSLLSFYCSVGDIKPSNRIEQEDSSTQILEATLSITQSEASHVGTQIKTFQDIRKNDNRKRVHFTEDRVLSVQDFLSCFVCQPHVSKLEALLSQCITLKASLSAEKKRDLGDYLFRNYLQGGTEENLHIFMSDALSSELLKNLLLDYWLSSDDREVLSVASLCYLIKGFFSKIGDETRHAWMLSAQQLCRQTTCILPAYLLALTLRSLVTESGRNMPNDKKSSEEIKEKRGVFTQGKPSQGDMDSWGLLVRQLEDTLSISCLLNLPSDTGQVTQVSVNKILEAGRGSVAEIVGSELARRRISVNDLFSIQNSQEAMDASMDQPSVTSSAVNSSFHECISELQRRFPHSLENDVLLSNCCWENAVIWNKEVQLLKNLECSLEYLKLIQNAVLRHGVASMMWQMFVTERFASLAQLMEKVGKVPKDRLCRKEVGVEEADLSRLTACMVDLLQALMEANCEVNEVPVFNIEPTWQSVRGPHSLVDLAIEAKMTNYGLIRHHYHLSILMNAVAVFKMKSVKVISLFDSKGRHAFFTEFTQHPLLPSPNVDDSICYSRSEFLRHVISHAVQTLDSGTSSSERTLSDGQSTSACSSPIKRKSTIAVKWPNLVLDIAKDFGLDVDMFKRHHVCELYSNGHDKAAEEILITVNDHEAVGSQLLQIAGKRINHYLLVSNKMEGVELLSNISPSLSLWIRSQDPSNLRKPENTTQSISMLLQHVLSNLPEGYTEYNTALELVGLVQSMMK